LTRWVDLAHDIPGLRGSGIHVVPAAAEGAIRETLARRGFEVRALEGSRAEGESAFFGEAARCLDLPSWFGASWDAFNDCLTDLVLGEAPPIAVLWRDAHLSLRADLQTVLNAVLAFEAAAGFPEGPADEPRQLVVFLLGEGSGFGRGDSL
jgi:RNAse (barnase) inhibitor barstar